MIAIKIDVTKISKDRLFKGAKGTYLNAILIDTPDGKYGDFMICEEQSKEEREAKTQRVILGNGKYVGRKAAPKNEAPEKHKEPIDDSIPF